jgi:DNA polymerase-1
MRKPFILIDVNNLGHRALHTVGDLTHPDDPTRFTGALFQIWKTCEQLERRFNTWNLAFCFDSKHSKRKELYPEYKGNREAKRAQESPSDAEKRQGMYQQIDQLPGLLHMMGAKNLLMQRGYEADDMMAAAIQKHPELEFVMVSSDKDLYQCLKPNVRLYNPVKGNLYTEVDFITEWDIPPVQWASAKAWAGCDSDNVPGLPGVAEKTACKWLRGQIKEENSKYKTFVDNLSVYSKNMPLVYLPLKGAEIKPLVEQTSRIQWLRLADNIGAFYELGMPSYE